MSLLVTQEEVVHDGTIMKVLEGRHVLHPSDAAVVHGLHLLSGECILLVGIHLQQKMKRYGYLNHVKNNSNVPKLTRRRIKWFYMAGLVSFPSQQQCTFQEEFMLNLKSALNLIKLIFLVKSPSFPKFNSNIFLERKQF